MTASTLLIASCLLLQADAPIVVDAAHRLFLDDHLIAESENVTRQVHAVKKFPGNPVLRATEPWENDVAILYGSVLHDGDKYRVWYHAAGHVGYAESPDGLAWTKPRLGIVEIEGQDTNLVLRRGGAPGEPGAIPYFYEVFGVHRDDREADPNRRYKMGFLSLDREYSGPSEDPFHRGQRRALGVAASPDGIHWTLVNSWATDAICDGGTHWTFDPKRGKYLLYGRTKHVDPALLEAWGENDWVRRYYWGRSVARVESNDFFNWNFTRPASAPMVMSADAQDPPGSETYSMQVFPYESVYIGLVQIFHNRPGASHLDLQLAVSHDSVHFTRVGDRKPFIPCGAAGTWDRFNNSVANNPPLRVGDELRFYYGGRTSRHGPYEGDDRGRPGGGIGFGTIRRDRFVSLDASYNGGRILTKPLELQGTQLHLNAKSDFGQILIEALDAAGQTIARSKPISEDALDTPVQWAEGGLENISSPVTLRITLENAQLFALWCS